MKLLTPFSHADILALQFMWTSLYYGHTQDREARHSRRLAGEATDRRPRGAPQGTGADMAQGFCVWLTGLSDAGKTTLATLLEQALLERGLSVEVLDGDHIRRALSPELGFSQEDRDLNIRRIGFLAQRLAHHGVAVIAAAISPFRRTRDEVRAGFEHFVEVFVSCPIEVLKTRDTKGLYRRFAEGQITGLAGLDDPYEPPLHPEVVVSTDRETPVEGMRRVLGALELLKLIPAVPGEEYSEEETRVLEKRLKDLGYI